MFAHISRNIFCLSLLSLVYPATIHPLVRLFVLVHPSSSLGTLMLSLFYPFMVAPSLSAIPLAFLTRTQHSIFGAVFTFEIKQGTNSMHRAFTVIIQPVTVGLDVLEFIRMVAALSRSNIEFYVEITWYTVQNYNKGQNLRM